MTVNLKRVKDCMIGIMQLLPANEATGLGIIK